LDTVHAAVAAACQSIAPFEHADTPLAPGAVSLAATKPALTLHERLFGMRFSKSGNADSRDTRLLGGPLVGGRPKAPIGRQQARRVTEGANMGIDGRGYQGPIFGSPLVDLVVDHDLILGLLDLDQLTELGGLEVLPLRIASVCGSNRLNNLFR
jgi:hypothetical protein